MTFSRACNGCTPIVNSIVTNCVQLHTTKTSGLEDRIQALEKKLDSFIQKDIPEAVTNCMKAVEEKLVENIGATNNNLSSTVDEQLTKMQETVSTSVENSIQNTMWSEVVSRKKGGNGVNPVKQIFKQAALEHQNEELTRDDRLKNFIVYRAPESKKETADERKNEELTLVTELLTLVGVKEAPEKIVRLGQFNKGELNNGKSRPLKVTMKSAEAQSTVMDNLNKLGQAPDHLKALSVYYDMTQTERKFVKDRVDEAKEKSSKNPNWVYKMRGPPWNLQEKRYAKQ